MTTLVPVWSGKLIANGNQWQGNLGFPSSRDSTAVNAEYVPDLTDAIDYAVMPYRGMVVIKSDGTMWSCGSNYRGQLGIGNSDQDYVQYGLTQIGTDTNWVMVTTGAPANMGLNVYWALKSNGNLYWWGDAEEYPNINESPVLLATGMQDLTRVSLDNDAFVIYHLEADGVTTFKYGSIPSFGGYYRNFPWLNADPDSGSFDPFTLHDFTPSNITNVKYFATDGYRQWYAIKYDGTLRADPDQWGAYQNNSVYPDDHTVDAASNAKDFAASSYNRGYLGTDQKYYYGYYTTVPIPAIDDGPFEFASGFFQDTDYLIKSDGSLYENANQGAPLVAIDLDGKLSVEAWGSDSGGLLVAAEGTFESPDPPPIELAAAVTVLATATADLTVTTPPPPPLLTFTIGAKADGSLPLTANLDEVRITVGATRDTTVAQTAVWPAPGADDSGSDNGWVDITAHHAGYASITKRFTVTRARAGVPGADGSGTDGDPGPTGPRGPVQIIWLLTGTAIWSDAQAEAALTAGGYGAPQVFDMVTLYKPSEDFAETRVFNGSAWIAVTEFIHGNLFVDGTILGIKLIADAITAREVGANEIISSSANLGNAVVTTLKIGDEQVTVPRYAQATSTVDVTSETTVLTTPSLDVGASSVIVMMGVLGRDGRDTYNVGLETEYSVDSPLNVYLKRDGTTIASFSNNTMITFTIQDTPGTGTHTYTVTAQCDGGGAGDPYGWVAQVYRRWILVLGVMR